MSPELSSTIQAIAAIVQAVTSFIGVILGVITLLVAVYALNAWKEQFAATQRADLGRKYKVAIYKLKDQLADVLILNILVKATKKEPSFRAEENLGWPFIEKEYSKQMRAIQEAGNEVKAILHDVRAIWGDRAARTSKNLLDLLYQVEHGLLCLHRRALGRSTIVYADEAAFVMESTDEQGAYTSDFWDRLTSAADEAMAAVDGPLVL